MTYIIGWKRNNSVFLSGDIAITRRVKYKLTNTESIFGGRLVDEDSLSVNEECLKLFKINEKLILSFAGDVDAALGIIEQIQNTVDDDDPFVMLEFIIKRIDPTHKFSLFIGLLDKEDKARLFSYNLNQDHKFLEHEEPIQDGSLGSDIKEKTTDLCNFSNEVELTDSDVLCIVNTVHQSFIINDDLLKNGVGGVFCGLVVSSEGVEWQRDTHLIIYDLNDEGECEDPNDPNEACLHSALIGIAIRDGALRCSTPFREASFGRSVIYNCQDIPRTTADFEKKKDMVVTWHDKWLDETDQMFNDVKSEYYGFISRTKSMQPKVVVFTYDCLEYLNIKIEVIGEGRFDIVTNGPGFFKSIRPTNPDKAETQYCVIRK